MALYSSVLQMYLNWANSLLCERGVLVSDVQELQDGRIFALLIDVLNSDEITFTETEDDEETNLLRIQAVLTYLQQQEIGLKASAKDVLRGDMKSILDTLWALILHFTIHNKETPSSRRTLRNGRLTLMEWCHDQLPAETFKMHWSITDNFRESNSLAELIEICSSSDVLEEEQDSPVRRLTTALIAAEETLGILKSHLSPADVIHGTANEYSIIIFLALLKRKVALLAPESSVISTPSPDPQCHLSDHIPEPWASLLHNTFSFKFVRADSLSDRLNLFKSSLAANASSNAPQDSYADSVVNNAKPKSFAASEQIDSRISSSVRHLEISHNHSELSQHRTRLTNGRNIDWHSISGSSDVKSANSIKETFHESIVSDQLIRTSKINDITGVPSSGVARKSDSHVGSESLVQMNGPIRGLWEEEALSQDYILGGKGGRDEEVRGSMVGKEEEMVGQEEEMGKSEVHTQSTDGTGHLGDNVETPKGQSFEDELLGLLEMIGMEGKQMRKELDSAQEREVYLLGQLQETVAGKHEEKVIARLIQELEMLRRENQTLFRELADARSEVSCKTQNCEDLRNRCRQLETELQRAKLSGDHLRREGSHTESEMSLKELRDENENLVGNGQRMSDARSSSGLEEMMRQSVEENHQLRSELAAYAADNSQKYHKTKEALKISEAENSELREKCRKLKRSVDDMRVDMEIKEKRMGRYERYLEILRQQNAKLIAHIGGKPLVGDERVDIAKMELEEIKEEYKEVRKKLELAEEDRTLLSRELEQMKSGRALTDVDGMPSLESALPEFHKLPVIESPKGQRKSEGGERITSVAYNSVDKVDQVKSTSSCTVLNKDDRGTADGTGNVSRAKGHYIPEVQKSIVNGHISDASSLKSYDVSETETAQSDSEHMPEGPSVDTIMAHSRLAELRQRFGLQKSVRSPSLGSLIRARATEEKCQGGAESEGFEESGLESSLQSDDETFQTPAGERLSNTSTLPPRAVYGGIDVNTNLYQGKTFTPAKYTKGLDDSMYYTPTDNLQHLIPRNQEARNGSTEISSVITSRTSQSLLQGTSSTRLVTSQGHGDSEVGQQSGTGVGSWHTANDSRNVTLSRNVYPVGQRSQHHTISGEHKSMLGSLSSRMPRWRQLRYSRAKSLHDSKSGPFTNQVGKIGDIRSPLGPPVRGRIPVSPGYPSVKTDLQNDFSDLTDSRYVDGSSKQPLHSLHTKTGLNIPYQNDDEFKPLPDQLVEPKKLADVTPPRNQRSPLATNRQESAVKVRLSFEDADSANYNSKPGSTQTERISISNENHLHYLKEPDGTINERLQVDPVLIRQVTFGTTRLTNEASSRSIQTSPKSKSIVDNIQKEGVQNSEGGLSVTDEERNTADIVAMRVIRQADSGISLSSINCDGSLAERGPGYVHMMLSPADQTYANSIIDKYLAKT